MSRIGSFVAVVAASVVVGWATFASACIVLPWTVKLPSRQVPLMGPVLLDLHCHWEKDCEEFDPRALRVLDGENVVAGSVSMIRAPNDIYLAFKPSQAFSPGRTYTLQVHENRPGSSSLVVQAVADFQWQAPAAPKTRFASVEEQTGPSHCCSDGCDAFPVCFTEQLKTGMAVSAGLSAPSDAAISGLLAGGRFDARPDAPYLAQFSWREADGSVHEGPWGREVRAVIQQPTKGGKYCATLTLMSRADGQRQNYESCHKAPGVRVGKVRRLTLAQLGKHYKNSLYSCLAAPGASCNYKQATCEGGSPSLLQAWCRNRVNLCKKHRDYYCQPEYAPAYCAASPNRPKRGEPAAKPP